MDRDRGVRRLAFGLCVCWLALAGGTGSAQAASTLHAYATGAAAPAGCPQEGTPASGCSLTTALADAAAGDTVALATPGSYVGNWSIGTSGTSSGAPVTIDGSGAPGAALDGNGGSGTGCTTAACDGPVLTVSNNMFLALKDLTIRNADNSTSGEGGGLQNIHGGTVTITGSTFTANNAQGFSTSDGGAIDNADRAGGTGTVQITDSTFSGDSAVDGAEIDTSDGGGNGTLSVYDSTLVAASGGPAVTAGRNGGTGTAAVAGDIFATGCQQNGGSWADQGYNAGADGTCFGNGAAGDVNAGSAAALDLGPLASNGGPTQTIAPTAGSPVIGIVPVPQFTAVFCGTDQRGDPRPGTGKAACDAGAYETQLPTLYAYAAGASTTSGCPQTTTGADQCSLGRALSLTSAGDTIKLATPGAGAGGANYIGNWSIATAGTSAGAPVTIDGSGVTGATLDGNHGSATGCGTASCSGPVLNITNNMFLGVKGLRIQNANDTTVSVFGGGVLSDAGGTLTISDVTFSGNHATDGGAIASGNFGSGSVSITNSTFANNSAGAQGGAIENADGGSGTLTVTGSMFTGNTAGTNGGAITTNNGSNGAGTATISDSTFSGDLAGSGGNEIDTSDFGGHGTLVLVGSTLVAGSGHVDVAGGRNNGSGSVFVAGDVFATGCQQSGGTWTDQGYNAGADGTCFGNGVASDVNAGSAAALELGSLQDNGGPTQTMALPPSSPAVGIAPGATTVMLNGGQVQLCGGAAVDQRAFPRPGGGKSKCDAGAYETTPLLYAYANGSSTASGCPQTAAAANQCSLGEALALAGPGDTVKLATPGAAGLYVGNWSIGTTGTTAGAPVTIDGSDVTGATLDGNHGMSSGCTTAACNGSVLTVSNAMHLVIQNLTIQHANNDNSSTVGGGLRNSAGGTVTVTGSTFTSNDGGVAGGAIANGDGGSGTVTVTGSTFSGNSAHIGGAIDNGSTGCCGGLRSGTVMITGSTFTGNNASVGGAIDNGYFGSGAVTVSGSTFSGNLVGGLTPDGGAIDNADGGSGSVTISDSTFSGDTATDGAEIDTSDRNGNGTLVLSGSTLVAAGGGPAVTAGRNGGSGQVFVAGDVFATGCQQNGGTWTDTGYNAGADSTCFGSGVAGDVNAGSAAALDLGSLANNGGPTQTIALGPGSPAANIIPNPTTVALNSVQTSLCPGSDQRGDARPGNGKARCDAGAFETQPASPTVQITTPQDGASYLKGASVNAAYTCSEGTGAPGIASCMGTVAAGAAIDTATLGQHAFSVIATSYDGLATTKTVQYSIVVAVNTSLPKITGTALPGDTLTCSAGTWTNHPAGYGYAWLRNGHPITGATGSSYLVQIADEAASLSCRVTAAGASAPATSHSVFVGNKNELHCPAPTGSISGTHIGPLTLGMTLAQAKHILPNAGKLPFGYINLCLRAGFGIRVSTPSTLLLSEIPAAVRRQVRGRIIIALTANPFYSINRIKPGMTITQARRLAHIQPPIQVGANTWYLIPGSQSTGVLKVRQGLIYEIGIANRTLTSVSRQIQRRFFGG